MPHAFRRILTFVVSFWLLTLQPFAPVLLGPDRLLAADGSHERQPSGKSKRKGSQVNIGSSLGLLTVQNLRTAISPGMTRLVLDLDRRAKTPKRPAPQAEGIVIEIPNATLGKSAQDKLAKGKVAKPFVVTQASDHSVAVSLPAGSYQTYRLLSLSNPPRLVVDVIPSTQPGSGAAQEFIEPPLPVEPPPQPLPPLSKSFKTIVIDPGHGGKDPGARGQRGTEEKDITLRVALKLRDILNRQPGLRVLMTRERDVFVELEDRAKFANGNEADLFVSIHVNSHPQRTVRGIEIYHFGEAKDQRALEVAARENGTPLNSTGVGWEYLVADLLTAKKIEESLELAWTTKEAMISHLNGHYALVDHGVKTAPFYVLRFTSMPSILAEIAYISNSAEEDLLRTNSFVTRVAESLQEGVKAFLAASKRPIR